MEVFRTCGSGKSYADERLFRLVRYLGKHLENDYDQYIDIINDHKGTLYVHFKTLPSQLIVYISHFIVFWENERECLYEFYFNGQLIENIQL